MITNLTPSSKQLTSTSKSDDDNHDYLSKHMDNLLKHQENKINASSQVRSSRS